MRDAEHTLRRYAFLVTIILAMPALADNHVAPTQKVFVPFAPYVEANRATIKTEMLLKGQCSEQVIDAILDSAERTGYIFSIESMAYAFPKILNSDHLNISCNKPQVRMEFLSVMSTNTVMVKILDCDPAPTGMMCTPPIERLRYFLTEPSKTIELSGGATFSEASAIIQWFRDDAGDYFSDAQKRKIRQLSWRVGIDKNATGFMFRIGDSYCECVLTLKLNNSDVLATNSQIALDGEPQFQCSQ